MEAGHNLLTHTAEFRKKMASLSGIMGMMGAADAVAAGGDGGSATVGGTTALFEKLWAFFTQRLTSKKRLDVATFAALPSMSAQNWLKGLPKWMHRLHSATKVRGASIFEFQPLAFNNVSCGADHGARVQDVPDVQITGNGSCDRDSAQYSRCCGRRHAVRRIQT